MQLRKILIFSLGILSSVSSYAQEQSLYPAVATIYSYESSFVNAAAIADTGHYEVDLVNKFRASNRGNVGHFAMTAGLTLRKDARVHGLNLVVVSDKEGPYINRNKGYLNYALQLPLTSTAALYSGISVGFSSTYINASSATTVNNFTVPDANLGVGFKNKHMLLGVTMMQALNNSVLPEITSLRLTRYYHFFGNYGFTPSTKVRVEAALFYRLFQDLENQLNAAATVTYNKMAGLRLVGHSQRGFSFFADFTIPRLNNQYAVTLGYNTGWGALQPTLHQSVEVGLALVVF